MRQERTFRRAQRQTVAGIEVVSRTMPRTRHGKAVTKVLKRAVVLSVLLHLALAARARVDGRAFVRTSCSGGVEGNLP